jgi:hypothetical protein
VAAPTSSVSQQRRDAWSTSAALHTVVSTIANSRSPRIAAAQLIDLIESTGSIHSAAATLSNGDRPPELIAKVGDDRESDQAARLRYVVHASDDQKIEVSLVGRNDVESIATRTPSVRSSKV